MIAAEVRRKAIELPGLPTLPAVVSRIVEVSGSERSCAAQLGTLIEADHAVTARVLRLANSALYRRSRAISSVRQAVVVLGFDTVQLLALSVSALDSIAKIDQNILSMEEFWLHAFGTASCAREIVRVSRAKTDPSLCFTAGLLHDIGKVLLATAYGPRYAALLQRDEESSRSLASLEKDAFGTHHGEVAGWLCDLWNFPPALADAIRDVPRASAPNSKVIALANQFAIAAGFGACGDQPDCQPDADLARSLGIDEALVAALLARFATSRDRIRSELEEWKRLL